MSGVMQNAVSPDMELPQSDFNNLTIIGSLSPDEVGFTFHQCQQTRSANRVAGSD